MVTVINQKLRMTNMQYRSMLRMKRLFQWRYMIPLKQTVNINHHSTLHIKAPPPLTVLSVYMYHLVNEVGYDALNLVRVNVLLTQVLQGTLKRLQVQLVSASDQIPAQEGGREARTNISVRALLIKVLD